MRGLAIVLALAASAIAACGAGSDGDKSGDAGSSAAGAWRALRSSPLARTEVAAAAIPPAARSKMSAVTPLSATVFYMAIPAEKLLIVQVRRS